MNGKREYGDYQTPLSFVSTICEFLLNVKKIKPKVVLEPTCGLGNFLKGSLIFNADEYYGIEINPKYCTLVKQEISDVRVHIINADLFSYDLKSFISDNLLVIGNPPWVTNSTLSSLNSNNLPTKTNFKGMKGMDALTGASNFDICEYILTKLLCAFKNTHTTIALLCKTSVARNIFKEVKRQGINFAYCELYEFDATKIFGINASACLFLLQLTPRTSSPEFCTTYALSATATVKAKFGYQNGAFYSDLTASEDSFDGKCCFEWRQGVKHDCSCIMELSSQDGNLINGKQEIVHIEPNLVYPLVKSSMFKKPVISTFSKYVLVTQKKIREDTKHISTELPQTWEYLNANKELFEARKSSIYRNAPAFSMFGVGDYAYSPFKVGISGFYKDPLFSVLFSPDKKPVMTDDTGYFICFSSYDAAYTAMLFLNSYRVRSFLKKISFADAKRPYTKQVLARLNFAKIYGAIGLEELKEIEQQLQLTPYVTAQMLQEFASVPEMSQQNLF